MKRLTAWSILLWAAPALAASLAGVTLPDTEGDLVLNGLGLREATFLKVDVYVAGLYLPRKSDDPSVAVDPATPKRLVMHFVRDVKKDDIVKAWREGFAHTAGDAKGALQGRIDTLNGYMEDMAKGETMTYAWTPGKGLAVQVKGQDKGILPGDDLSRAFFLIWLGDEPPNEELKTGLLGK